MTEPGDEATPNLGGNEHHQDESSAERQARWMGQLQAMIDGLATAARPALREVGAKAAELAAKAGDAAGPFAQRAAVVTSDVGQRVAARSREIATDLRRPADTNGSTPDGRAVEGTTGTPDAVDDRPTS